MDLEIYCYDCIGILILEDEEYERFFELNYKGQVYGVTKEEKEELIGLFTKGTDNFNRINESNKKT